MPRPIRLNAFDMNCVAHQSPGLWRHPDDRGRHYTDLNHWVDLAQILDHAVRDGADLAVRPARGHDHDVGEAGFAGENDGDGVLGLHVVDTGEDEAKGLLGVRTHLGDLDGGAPRAGP